jgi:hypothetical protein
VAPGDARPVRRGSPWTAAARHRGVAVETSWSSHRAIAASAAFAAVAVAALVAPATVVGFGDFTPCSPG